MNEAGGRMQKAGCRRHVAPGMRHDTGGRKQEV